MYKVCLTTDMPDYPEDMSNDFVVFLNTLLQRDATLRPSVSPGTDACLPSMDV